MQLPPVVEGIKDLVGGIIGATRQKEWCFLKWADLTYSRQHKLLRQRRAVLTLVAYKPKGRNKDASALFMISGGVQPLISTCVSRLFCVPTQLE